MRLILLLFGFFLITELLAQNLAVTYLRHNTFNFCNDANLMIAPRHIVQEKGTLLICGNVSKYILDSVSVESVQEGGSLYIPGLEIYHNYSDKIVFSLYKENNSYKGEKQSLNAMNSGEWEIDNKKRKYILGVECTLAVRKTNRPENCYEYAWFAASIPYSDGCDISQVGALPGLILEFYTEKRDSYSYIATDIKIIDNCPFAGLPDFERVELKSGIGTKMIE